jgi:hypothetical protein
VTKSKKKTKKSKTDELSLSGTILSGQNLPNTDTGCYVTVQLTGGKKDGAVWKSPFSWGSRHAFDFHFDLGKVRKNQNVDLAVFLSDSDVQIASATVKTKDLELDHLEPITIKLQKPKEVPDFLKGNKHWGELSVVLNYHNS